MTADKWVLEKTLGGKAKPFYWKIDDKGSISIKRMFGNQEKLISQTVNAQELGKIDKYLSDGGWKALANDVEKLKKGTEKPGIGKFMYDNLEMNEAEAQLSSHLGAIFSNAGAWLYNGKKRGIEFKKNTDNWAKVVREYYLSSKPWEVQP